MDSLEGLRDIIRNQNFEIAKLKEEYKKLNNCDCYRCTFYRHELRKHTED